MKKDELMQLVGKWVTITFKQDVGGGSSTGVLGFTKEFSEEYDYRHPDYFTINNISFKVSHVEKVQYYDL